VGGRVWRVGWWAVLLIGLASFVPHSATQLAAAPASRDSYTHLGATTLGDWGQVSGQLTVTDPTVRPGSYDFVAARFMAKQETSAGIRWLEAGWAEVGWSGDGRQRVYTFDTSTNQWTFYDQYPLRPGDHVAFLLLAGADGQWHASVFWHAAWYPLTSTRLPAGPHALIEEYVEVYQDPTRPGAPLSVPPVNVSGVTVAGPGPTRPWTDTVPSYRGGGDQSGYCVTRFDAWSDWRAGSCSSA
jgi:hypothetical protein